MDILDEPWFRVRDAVARGHSRSSLKSTRLESPFYGVRAQAGLASNLEQVCAAYATKMAAGSAFTEVTSARLWGLPLPAYLGFDIGTVTVASQSPRRAPRGMNVVGRQYDPRHLAPVSVRGLPVLPVVDTWCSLARILDPIDLVALADHAAATRPYGPPKLASLADLRAAVDRRRGMRGERVLRWAVERVRTRAWSRPESLIRVGLTGVGLPEPACNHPITVRGRRFFLDLAWPEYRFGIEYDGDSHRDPTRFTSDIHRQEVIQDHGWALMRVTRADLFDRTAETMQRIERRLSVRGCPVSVDLSHLVIPRR